MQDLDDNTIDFREYEGKILLVDFWATWCGPCRKSIPHLSELHTEYAEQGFEVIGISLDRIGKDAVKKALDTLKAMGHDIKAEPAVIKDISNLVGSLWKQRENPDVVAKISDIDEFNPFIQRQVVEFAMLMTMSDRDFKAYIEAQEELRRVLQSARKNRS